MRYQPEWAPDGKRIAFSDKDGKVYVVTLADKKLTRDCRCAARPDSRLRLVAARQLSGLQHDERERLPRRSTSGARPTASCDASPTRCSMPTIRPGTRRATIFTSSAIASSRRRFRRSNSTTRPTARPASYALALRKDVKHPFPPESDEVTLTDDREAGRRRQAGREAADKTAADEAARRRSEKPPTEPLDDRLRRHRRDASRAFRSAPTTTAACRRRTGTCSTPSAGVLLRPRRAIGRRRCGSLRSRIARRRRWPKTCAATRFRTTARRCWSRRAATFNIYDATPQGDNDARRRFRPPG